MGVYRSQRKQGRLLSRPTLGTNVGATYQVARTGQAVNLEGKPPAHRYNADLEQKKGDQKIAPTDSDLAEAAR